MKLYFLFSVTIGTWEEKCLETSTPVQQAMHSLASAFIYLPFHPWGQSLLMPWQDLFLLIRSPSGSAAFSLSLPALSWPSLSLQWVYSFSLFFSSHHSVGSWKPVHILLLFTHQPSVIHLLHHPKTVVAEDSHSFPVAQARGHLAARLFLSCWCLTSVATYSTVKHSCLGPVVPHWHLNWTSSTSLVCSSSSGLLAWVLVFSRPEHILNQTPPPSDAFFSEVPILFLCGWLLDQLLRVPTHIWKPIKWVTQVTSSYGEGLILIWEGSSLI